MSVQTYLMKNLASLSEKNILKSIDGLKKEQLRKATEEKQMSQKANFALGQPVETLF